MSSGLVMLSVNIFSVMFMWSGEAVNNIPVPEWADTSQLGVLIAPIGLMLVSLNTIAVIFFYSYKGVYLRLSADNSG